MSDYYHGQAGDKEYPFNPDSEKVLFKDAIADLPDGELKGVEIGVLYGDTSRFLLSLRDTLKLVGIDPIIPDSMERTLVGSIDRIIANTSHAGSRWEFVHDYSTNAYARFEDGSLDFVFVDGSHHYEDVKADYECFRPKIKSGGLMFFHDSRMYRGGAKFHPGSSKFVEELVAAGDMELVGEAFSLTAFRVR